ncbi:RNA-binding protein with serine-rich domain [Lachnellula suecica]|uniref:RNA-binding protein with serine-rich domain n=1 Tax=Lachnellula suecica TaxID=602035 RepID=A0A8T9C6B8_9HELO|nr:RNA-binding protein with serine-rich domain [Lachnellula suecica]
MPSRSPSRGRQRSRSPYSDHSHPDSRSASRPRRTISPRSLSRSPRRNGRYRSASRSASRGRSPSPVRSTKVVIEKLTKNVNEEHLREIFGSYGQIRDLDMPMNRQFNTNRGTAYILYTSEADAEAAIAHMHESQIDGAIINVSIVLPRRKFSPSPPLARRGANIDPRGPPLPNFRGPPPPLTDEPRETSILTDQGPCLDQDRQDATERDPDRSLLDRARRPEDEEVDVTARDVMQVEGGGAQVIAAIAVMMTGAGAEVELVEVELGEDVRRPWALNF